MIPSITDIKSYVEAAYNLPWWAISAIFSFLVCVALRRSNKFPNAAIPLVCLLLCSIGTMITAPPAPATFRAVPWRIINFMIGGIVGFAVWGFHGLILQKLAGKFPWLNAVLTGEDNSTPVPVPAREIKPPVNDGPVARP